MYLCFFSIFRDLFSKHYFPIWSSPLNFIFWLEQPLYFFKVLSIICAYRPLRRASAFLSLVLLVLFLTFFSLPQLFFRRYLPSFSIIFSNGCDDYPSEVLWLIFLLPQVQFIFVLTHRQDLRPPNYSPGFWKSALEVWSLEVERDVRGTHYAHDEVFYYLLSAHIIRIELRDAALRDFKIKFHLLPDQILR